MGVLGHFRAYIHEESVHIGDRTQDGGVHDDFRLRQERCVSVTPSSTAAAGGAGEGGVRLDLAQADLAQQGLALPDLEAVFALTDETAADGRVARGQRTRRSVADALDRASPRRGQ